VINEGGANGREGVVRAASTGFEAGMEGFSSEPPIFILLLPFPALLLLVPSLGTTLALPLSTLTLPEETTGLVDLAELKYRPPPGLDEKKDEYALQFAGSGGLKRRGMKDMSVFLLVGPCPEEVEVKRNFGVDQNKVVNDCISKKSAENTHVLLASTTL